MGDATMGRRGRRTAGVLARSLVAAALLVAASACGGDDAGDTPVVETTDVDGAATATTDTETATTDANGADTDTTDTDTATTDTDDTDTETTDADGSETTVASGSPAGDEIDVCALVTEEEVEAIIGMAAGPAQPEESAPPFFGCRYEEEGLSQTVTIGLLAWNDADEAESSFDFGADQYPAVEGIGDRAYNSQPIDDLSVLAGRYELSVGLYFVSDDDEADLAMAIELAQLALDRLP